MEPAHLAWHMSLAQVARRGGAGAGAGRQRGRALRCAVHPPAHWDGSWGPSFVALHTRLCTGYHSCDARVAPPRGSRTNGNITETVPEGRAAARQCGLAALLAPVQD